MMISQVTELNSFKNAKVLRERSLLTEIKKVYEWQENFVLKLNQKRLKNYENTT